MGVTWRRAKPTYLALVLAFLTAMLVIALLRLEHVVLIAFVSVLFAAALSSPTAKLEQWHVPSSVSVPVIYLTTLAAVIFVLWLITPPLFAQLAGFSDQAPQYAERYRGLREAYNDIRENYPSLASFDQQVSRLGESIFRRVGQRAVGLPSDLFRVFLDLLSVFVISTLLVSSRRRILAFILSMVHPEYRDEVRDVLTKMWTRIGYYVRAKVIVMAIVGVLMYVALRLIGVPFAVPLSIIVAFGEIIPRAGPWLARIPLLGIAALDGWKTFVLTLVASVVIENLKGLVISPLVEGQQLDIPPLAVFISVLVGGALFGVGGAVVAVPAWAMLQVLLEEVVIPWRQRQLALAGEPPLPPPA
jgi:predicted PurR-regulated permease PerM